MTNRASNVNRMTALTN